MDKNKFLDKIFEEFERRLTRVIELGYCSMSLEVENSLKTILTKTVNSSAGIQTKVLKEITTMKEYVVEVVSEDKNTNMSANEDTNVQLPVDMDENVNPTTETNFKPESTAALKDKKDKHIPKNKKDKHIPKNTIDEPENLNLPEKEAHTMVDEDYGDSLTHSKSTSIPDVESQDQTVAVTPKKEKTKAPLTNKRGRKCKTPRKQKETVLPVNKVSEPEFIDLEDSLDSSDIKLESTFASKEEKILANTVINNGKDLNKQSKSVVISNNARKLEQNTVEETEMDTNANKKAKSSQQMGPKSKKIRSSPVDTIPYYEDELAMDIRLSMIPTEQTSQEVQDYVTACTKSMLEPTSSKPDTKTINKEYPTLKESRVQRNTQQQEPLISLPPSKSKAPITKPRKSTLVVKKPKRKKQKKLTKSERRKQHKKAATEISSEKAFKCNDCDYSSDKKGGLLLHVYNIHNKEQGKIKDKDQTDDVKVVDEKNHSKNNSTTAKNAAAEFFLNDDDAFVSAKGTRKAKRGKASKPNSIVKTKNQIKQIVQDIICL